VLTFVFRRLMARLKRSDRWYVALIWLIACAFGADWAGLHFMVGAFLAGVVMDADWFGRKSWIRCSRTCCWC
jgi:Kef-type K+ transport system membrane component KefB